MWGPHFLCTYTLTLDPQEAPPFCWIPSPSNRPFAFLLLAAAPSNGELPLLLRGSRSRLSRRRAPCQRERTSWACSKPIGWDAGGQDGASKVACPGSTLLPPPAARPAQAPPLLGPHRTAPCIAGSFRSRSSAATPGTSRPAEPRPRTNLSHAPSGGARRPRGPARTPAAAKTRRADCGRGRRTPGCPRSGAAEAAAAAPGSGAGPGGRPEPTTSRLPWFALRAPRPGSRS